MSVNLGEFEGKKVVGTTIALRRAGDGLSKALGIEPRILHQGDRIQVLLDVVVGPVGFIPVPDDPGAVTRKHDLMTETSVIVDSDEMRGLITDMAEKIARDAERRKGVQRLPTPDELEAGHSEGGHVGAPVAGCPLCDEAIAGTDTLPPLGDPPPPTDIKSARSRPKRTRAK